MQESSSKNGLQDNSALKADFSSPSPHQAEDPNHTLTIRKKRYDTRWKQQYLRAVRQNLSLLYVIILYLTIGVIFISIAALCYVSAMNYPKIIEKDYTNCKSINKTDLNKKTDYKVGGECFPYPKDPTKINFTVTKSIRCVCRVSIMVNPENLPSQEGTSLVLFVKLTEFLQNIRKFRKDVEWEQIRGEVVGANGKPLRTPRCRSKGKVRKEDKPIYPCGKVANSYFSDRFKILNAEREELPLDYSKIAWESDEIRFGQPKLHGKNLTDVFELPKDWHNDLKEEFIRDKKGVQDKRFMVWMRAAALDQFKKKYAHIPTLKKPGLYTVEIQYRYEVKSYLGSKKIVIAVDSQDRPVDFFFFYCYLIVGCACLLFVPMLYLVKVAYQGVQKITKPSKQPNQPSHPAGEQNASQNDMENNTATTDEHSSSSVSEKA